MPWPGDISRERAGRETDRSTIHLEGFLLCLHRVSGCLHLLINLLSQVVELGIGPAVDASSVKRFSS